MEVLRRTDVTTNAKKNDETFNHINFHFTEK